VCACLCKPVAACVLLAGAGGILVLLLILMLMMLMELMVTMLWGVGLGEGGEVVHRGA
jgi:hypothetical protein